MVALLVTRALGHAFRRDARRLLSRSLCTATIHPPKKSSIVEEGRKISSSVEWNMGANPMNSASTANLPVTKVLVISTGGTIGMSPNADGAYAPLAGLMESLIRKNPMLNDRGFETPRDFLALPVIRQTDRRVLYKMMESSQLFDSSDFSIDDWIRVAKEIERNYADYDGFVVLHGTDTMSYTASALSFMLENLSKPVVFTGSQIPFFEVRSDGLDNLLGALIAAGCLRIPEVTVYFDRRLFRGNRCRKLNSSTFNAFSSPNELPLANYGVDIKVRHALVRNVDPTKRLRLFDNLCRDVSFVRLFPSIPLQIVQSSLQNSAGVVLQTFGSGNAPSRRKDILREIKKAVDRGCVIVNCLQCIRGRVQGDYENGRVLSDHGVVSAFDMTPIAALAKLTYVLGQNASFEEKLKLMQSNLGGELTEDNNLVQQVRHDTIVVHSAAMRNDIAQLKTFKDVCNVRDHMDRTPLHTAAERGANEAVAHLIARGADVNAVDKSGASPLDYAARAGSLPSVRALCRANGKLSSKSAGVALADAAASGDLLRLQCFYEAGCVMSQTDHCGRSALLVAVACGQQACARYLFLQCGLSPAAADCCGHTAMGEVKRKHLQPLVEFFRDAKDESSFDGSFL